MTIQFVTERTEAVLSKAKFPSAFCIPNDHQCFDEQQKQLWKDLADAFGINLGDTGYTIKAVVKDGQVRLDTPFVGTWNNQACLIWGQVKQPLAALDKSKVELSIGGTKRPVMEAFIVSLEDTLSVFMMLPRDAREDSPKEHQEYLKADEEGRKNLLKKALRTNKLHLYLPQSYEKPKKISEVAGKTLEVYGYTQNKWGKYELVTNEGIVVANSAISRRLEKAPVITKEQPATLEVSQFPIRKTSSGYDVYYTSLITQADKELPVFDFSPGIVFE